MLAKRLFDLLCACVGLIMLAPLLLLCAAWIRLDSPGPALFRQWRVGRHGVGFRIYKFRTMRADADPAGPLSAGADPRVTRAGRLLRRHKLDELPQLINVVLGEMSLVGPRPELPRYVACYPPGLRELVLSVAPGMTDRAALLFRDEGTLLAEADDPDLSYRATILPAKLEHYARYVERRGFWSDLAIVGATLRLLFVVPLLERARALAKASLRWLPDSGLGADSRGAILFALMRGLASLEIAAAALHARLFSGADGLTDPPAWSPVLALACGFAHQAMLLFCLLSGWLVGGGLLGGIGRRHAMRDYALERVSRLWTVLIPALALLWCSGLVSGDLAQGHVAYDARSALGNLLGLQGILVQAYAGDIPLAGLSYLGWYYLLFALLMLPRAMRGGGRYWAPVCALIALCLLPPTIGWYFIVWLLGAGAAHLRIATGRLPRLLAGLLFAACALRLQGQPDALNARAIGDDLLYSALLLICLCGFDCRAIVRGRSARRLKVAGNFLASFSFSLYVLHLPLIGLLCAYRAQRPLSPRDPLSLAIFCAMLAMLIALSYLFHLPFEAQTSLLRQRIRDWLPGRAAPAAPRV